MPLRAFRGQFFAVPSAKTILLGLDGLDWQIIRPLIARGALPAFRHLVEHGVTGNLHTLEPTLSPMLWNSIATGKRAAKHGIHGFTEVDPHSEAVRPVSSLSRSCKAVWNILQQNGARCHLLNWFATQRQALAALRQHYANSAARVAHIRAKAGELAGAGAVPEPSTYAMMAGLLAGSAALYRHRQQKKAAA